MDNSEIDSHTYWFFTHTQKKPTQFNGKRNNLKKKKRIVLDNDKKIMLEQLDIDMGKINK